MISNAQVVCAPSLTYSKSSDGLGIGIDLRYVPEFNSTPRTLITNIQNCVEHISTGKGLLGDMLISRSALPFKLLKEYCNHTGEAIYSAVQLNCRADLIVFRFMKTYCAVGNGKSLGTRGLAMLLTPVSIDRACPTLRTGIADFLGSRLDGKDAVLSDGMVSAADGLERIIDPLGEALLAAVRADVPVDEILATLREIVVKESPRGQS